MIITILKKNYDTAQKKSRQLLVKLLEELQDKKPQLLSVRKQIEESPLISRADIKLYNACGKDAAIPDIKAFHTAFISYSEEQLANRSYTFLNGSFYILPEYNDPQDTEYALIDKLVYESMRHEPKEEPCLSLKAAIVKFNPARKKCSIATLSNLLAQKETSSGTYYSECLSDDSDSEEEERYSRISTKKKKAKREKATKYRLAAHSGKFFTAFKDHDVVVDVHSKERPVIKRTTDFDRRQALKDLDEINTRIEEGEVVDSQFLTSLDTQFVVAQYRGIHYVTSGWDAAARREHREADEVGKPQYSSAVFNLEGVKNYRDMLEKTRDNPNFNNQLAQTAALVEDLLLKMQQSDPCSFEGYAYCNLFLLLQKQYSANYDGFPSWVAAELKKKNSVLAEFVKTPHRPLFSTSDVPNHALKYAFGVKLYEGHKDERLRPRWQANLRAERPYSGKVYLSLHPLTDYELHKPSHLTSLFKHGLVNLPNVIVAERETSFLGYMPADRVVYHFKAKYPSFTGEYKAIFFHKYGISEPMYKQLQNAFRTYAPHTTERKNIIKSLGDYLAAYNEVRLVAKAEKLARKDNKVLIYRDEDGRYSLYLPDTPSTANKRLRSIIEQERDVYKAIAESSESRSLHILSSQQFAADDKRFRYIQSHHKILLNHGYTLTYLNSLEFAKLKLINKQLQEFIVADEDNLFTLLDFPLDLLALCSHENLAELLEDERITLEEIGTYKAKNLAKLLDFDNLQKPLDEGYTLKKLYKLFLNDSWHIRCLTAESLEDLILDDIDVPDLVLEYAEDQDADFDFIMKTLSRTERNLFAQRLEEYYGDKSNDAESSDECSLSF